MPTRCSLLEAVLVEERLNLWGHLGRALEAQAEPMGHRVRGLVARIRRISEALGYPSDWKKIPETAYPWFGLVEHYPLMGLYVLELPPADLDGVVPDDETRDFYAASFFPDPPDDGWMTP